MTGGHRGPSDRCPDCGEPLLDCEHCTQASPDQAEVQTVITHILGSDHRGALQPWLITADLPVSDLDHRISRMVEGIKAYHRHLGLEVYSIQVTRHSEVDSALSGSWRPRLIRGPGSSGPPRARLRLIPGIRLGRT